MKNIEKDLFDIFMEYGNDKYEMNLVLVKYIRDKVNETILKCNDNTSSILTELFNSINNAGWEQRHSSQIDLIRESLHKLEDQEYELTH